MSRILYHSPQILSTMTMEGKSNKEELVTQLRDEIRSTLDPSSTGDTWFVTDIAKWTGNTDGLSFVIEHRDGSGVKTGHEWLIFFPSSFDSGYYSHEMQDFWGGITFSDYWRYTDTGDPASGNIACAIGMNYNHNGGADGFDQARTDDGTNEMAAPITDPSSNGSGFMPSHETVRGMVVGRQRYHYDNKMRWNFVLVADDSKPFLQFASVAVDRSLGPIYLSGQIMTPYDNSVDNSNTGSVFVPLRYNNQGNVLNESSDVSEVFDHSGNRTTVGLNWKSTFNTGNDKRSDGTHPWNLVTASSSTLFKGYLDTDVVREQGAYERGPYRTFGGPDGPFIKWHRSMVFPWVSGEPVYPPGKRFSDNAIPSEGA